jgi:hypothetical protein
MLLINHADVVNRLLSTWNFPKRLVDAIAMHHLPDEKIIRLAPQRAAEVATLALANRLAHALLLGSSGNNCQYPTEALMRVLDLKADAIKFIEEQIPDQTADIKRAILKSDDGPPHTDCRGRLLKKIHRAIRPLYISANPAMDGHRILLERLRETNDNRRPNVAVVYVPNVRDAEPLFKTLREREGAACILPLPVIVISPSPNVTLDPKLFAGRDHETIPSPFALSRLADAMNTLLLSED